MPEMDPGTSGGIESKGPAAEGRLKNAPYQAQRGQVARRSIEVPSDLLLFRDFRWGISMRLQDIPKIASQAAV